MFSRNVLSSCIKYSKVSFRRSLATEQSTSTAPPPPKLSKKATRPAITTAIVLNRSPIITRTPTAFERAYYAYQARIQRALHNPFPYEFYFKPGSPIEARFNVEERKRERKAFGKPFGVEYVSKEAEGEEPAKPNELVQQEGEDEVSQSRIHAADISGDVKSLDRKGQRNIYLLVKEGGSEVWRFPQGGVEKEELLHESAKRDLHAECGPFMDTWIVSRNPIGHYKLPAASEAVTFFFKAHIVAGQVKPDGKKILDFAWLTKNEIESRVTPEYWLAVKDMLSDF